MIPSIGTFWLLYPTNHWKTALSIWSQLPQRVLFCEEDIPFFSKEVVNLCLFFTHVKRGFFGTPYFSATSLFVIPFSESQSFTFYTYRLLFNLHFMGTIFLSQRTKNGLFESGTPCLCFQKSNASLENVGMFEFQSKSSNSIEKLGEKKFELQREIHPSDRQICSTYQDVRVFECSSCRDYFARKGLVGSRGRQICSTQQDVRVSEYSSYQESAVVQILWF